MEYDRPSNGRKLNQIGAKRRTAGLANLERKDGAGTLVPQISQESLATVIGCARSRVNFFLNRFCKLGFIEYGERIHVKKGLLRVVLHG